MLVVSLLVSMMLSQLARTGTIWPGKSRKQSGSGNSMAQQDNAFHQNGKKLHTLVHKAVVNNPIVKYKTKPRLGLAKIELRLRPVLYFN